MDITQTEGYRAGFKAALQREKEQKEKERQARIEEVEKYMLERRNGEQDFRKGGMVLSTVDNRKNT